MLLILFNRGGGPAPTSFPGLLTGGGMGGYGLHTGGRLNRTEPREQRERVTEDRKEAVDERDRV